MAVLGLRFCARAFSSCGERGPLFIVVHGPLMPRPLLLWSTGSRCAGSAIVAHGPNCSAACGIFPDQGSNPCPLHWQADSQPLRHQGSPRAGFWTKVADSRELCVSMLLCLWNFTEKEDEITRDIVFPSAHLILPEVSFTSNFSYIHCYI